MKSFGYSLVPGFIGAPLISKNDVATGSGKPSFALPKPSKTLPSTCSDTGISITLPTNFAFVPDTERPEVPSKTCTTAFPFPTSKTLPRRLSPSVVSISTSSSNAALSTPSTITSGPLISAILLY